MKILKNKWFWVGIGVALLLGIVLISFKACNLGDENAELKGEMKAYKMVSAKNAEIANKTIASMTKVIADKDESLKKEKQKYTSTITVKDTEIAELKKKRAQATDCPEKLALAEKEIQVWTDKFALCEKSKSGIEFNLTEKYNAQVLITGAVQVKLTDCLKLQGLCDDRVTVLERSLKKARFVSKLKTWGGVALAGVIVYGLVKK